MISFEAFDETFNFVFIPLHCAVCPCRWPLAGGRFIRPKANRGAVKAKSRADLSQCRLQAEIQDLKSSQDAVQERARLQLGMIKRNEVFVQVMDQPSTVQPSASNPQNQQAATAAGNAASATQPNTQANPANPQTSAQPNARHHRAEKRRQKTAVICGFFMMILAMELQCNCEAGCAFGSNSACTCSPLKW